MNIRSSLSAREVWFLKGLGHKAVLQSAKSNPTDNTGAAKTGQGKSAKATAGNSNGNEPDHTDKPQDYATAQNGAKSTATKTEEADQSNEELFRVRTSRLVDLFPNELVIREKSITVIRRDLMMSQTETWPIEDIGEITLIDAPIYGGLHLVGKFPDHKLDLKGIPKDKATKAKELIDGLMLEDQEQIKLPESDSAAEHRKMLQEAGKLPEGAGPSTK